MTVESFGYQVLSLDELIADLQAIKRKQPHLGKLPVWVANCPPMIWPILVASEDGHDGEGSLKGVHIYVEKGK
jgi:hypothetical protein